MTPNHAWMPVRALAKRWEGHVQAGLLSREISQSEVPTRLVDVEGNIADGANRESSGDLARSENQGMYGIFMRENRESPLLARWLITGRAAQGTPMAVRLG